MKKIIILVLLTLTTTISAQDITIYTAVDMVKNGVKNDRLYTRTDVKQVGNEITITSLGEKHKFKKISKTTTMVVNGYTYKKFTVVESKTGLKWSFYIIDEKHTYTMIRGNTTISFT